LNNISLVLCSFTTEREKPRQTIRLAGVNSYLLDAPFLSTPFCSVVMRGNVNRAQNRSCVLSVGQVFMTPR